MRNHTVESLVLLVIQRPNYFCNIVTQSPVRPAPFWKSIISYLRPSHSNNLLPYIEVSLNYNFNSRPSVKGFGTCMFAKVDGSLTYFHTVQEMLETTLFGIRKPLEYLSAQRLKHMMIRWSDENNDTDVFCFFNRFQVQVTVIIPTVKLIKSYIVEKKVSNKKAFKWLFYSILFYSNKCITTHFYIGNYMLSSEVSPGWNIFSCQN